jgi:hypothetical protein
MTVNLLVPMSFSLLQVFLQSMGVYVYAYLSAPHSPLHIQMLMVCPVLYIHAHVPFALLCYICFYCCLQPRLVEVYDQSSQDGSLHITLQLEFPHRLVKHAGAPARAWLVLAAPADSDELQVTMVWQNKTATRLPEALWLRFKPARGAVARHTWLMHKLDGAISPSEVRHMLRLSVAPGGLSHMTGFALH